MNQNISSECPICKSKLIISIDRAEEVIKEDTEYTFVEEAKCSNPFCDYYNPFPVEVSKKDVVYVDGEEYIW